MTKSEVRNPKSEGNPKAEFRSLRTEGGAAACIFGSRRHDCHMKTLLPLLIWLLAARASSAGEDVGALVDKVADAYGGRAALESMAAVRETGRVEAATQEGNSKPMVRMFARPLKLRV